MTEFWDKIKSLFRKLGEIFSIFSFTGKVSFVIFIFSLLDFLSNVRELNEVYQLALTGKDISELYFWSYFYYGEMTLIIIYAIYLVLAFIFVLITKLIFSNKIHKNQYNLATSYNKISLNINNRFIPKFCLVTAKPLLYNETVDNLRIESTKIPKMYRKNDKYEAYISNLPTGKYIIKHLQFYFQDPLKILQLSKYVYAKDKTVVNVSDKSTVDKKAINQSFQNVKDNDTITSKNPTEGYYSVKEYSFGDETKRIHWKHTAKRHKIFIKKPEESPRSEEKIVLVLNMYFPYKINYELEEFVGDYLIYASEIIKKILIYSNKSIDLQINGKEKVFFENFHLYKPDDIPDFIIKNSIIQNKTPFLTFIKNENILNYINLTTNLDSWDKSNGKNNYIYNVAPYFKKGIFKRIVEGATIPKRTVGDFENSVYEMFYFSRPSRFPIKILNNRRLLKKALTPI